MLVATAHLRPFLDCLTEVDSAIGRLEGRGAGRIVVAGMSQGGDAALAYGALRANLAGIIALAPAAAPERQVGLPDIAESVTQARALVASGRGNEITSFVDRNAGGAFSVRTTVTIYLSYLDPQGPANMLDSIRKLHTPLLWVAGSADPSQTGANAEFNLHPREPISAPATSCPRGGARLVHSAFRDVQRRRLRSGSADWRELGQCPRHSLTQELWSLTHMVRVIEAFARGSIASAMPRLGVWANTGRRADDINHLRRAARKRQHYAPPHREPCACGPQELALHEVQFVKDRSQRSRATGEVRSKGCRELR